MAVPHAQPAPAQPHACVTGEPHQATSRACACAPLLRHAVHIEMDVVVRKDSQKVIVVGRSGEAIGGVMLAAEKELRRMWGTGVRLVLTVKVHKPG